NRAVVEVTPTTRPHARPCRTAAPLRSDRLVALAWRTPVPGLPPPLLPTILRKRLQRRGFSMWRRWNRGQPTHAHRISPTRPPPAGRGGRERSTRAGETPRPSGGAPPSHDLPLAAHPRSRGLSAQTRRRLRPR